MVSMAGKTKEERDEVIFYFRPISLTVTLTRGNNVY